MPKQLAAIVSMLVIRLKNAIKSDGYHRHELNAVKRQLESMEHNLNDMAHHENMRSNRIELMRIAGDAYQNSHFLSRRFAGEGPCECDNCARWEKAREGEE